MTSSELAAFNARIRHAAHIALIAAITIEARSATPAMRSRAAVAVLQALAEGLKESTAPSGAGIADAVPQRPVEQPANRTVALAQGFTGYACGTCLAFTMKRAGTCLTCQSCGSTTGCS